MKNINYCILALLFLFACKKNNFLDSKPNTNIVTPVTLDDMQQLLANDEVQTNNSPALDLMSSDEYYYPTVTVYNNRKTKTEKNAYIWNQDIYQGEINIPDWNLPYKAVFYANVVLDAWNKLPEDQKNSDRGMFIKGTALYVRARNFYNLAETFSPVYDATSNSPGIPIKLSSDVNEVVKRSSQKETYDQILKDLTEAVQDLPTSVNTSLLTFPSKVAAYAMLARISLYMREYSLALTYANNALQIKSDLLDFNTLNPLATYVFSFNNPEILDYKTLNLSYSAYITRLGLVAADSNLIALYDINDLRKSIYFKFSGGVYKMANSYSGTNVWPFTGLATDELYLIKAECLARAGQLTEALSTLNALIKMRYKTNTFSSYASTDKNDVINKILTERRKELVWRSLRWQDLKRLNKEGANITLNRQLNGQIYSLPTNDPRYVMPIPNDELQLSHIEQNPRQ